MASNQNHLFSEEEANWLFGDDVLSLQKLAAFQYTWKLWSDILLSGKYHNIKDDLETAILETESVVWNFIKDLKLASSMKYELMLAMRQAGNEVISWAEYNREQMIPHRKITLYTCHAKYIVFRPNTMLDFPGCARKLLSSNQLDNRTAFEVMCRFCMEDELEKLPKDEVRGYLKMNSWLKSPLVCYWICYLTDKNQLKDISRLHDGCCLEGVMILKKDVDNWNNIEWFWRRLCDETDQMETTAEVLRDVYKNWFLRPFYYLLNEDQWRFVFNTVPVEILMAFFVYYKALQQGYFLWERLKGSMTGEQFTNLMWRFMKMKEEPLCFPAATKLWNTAPDHLKNYVLYRGNSVVIHDFFESTFIRQFDKNLQFLFELLTFASAEYRERMILAYGDVLFQVDDFSKIDKIIKLCLPNASQRDEFKRLLTKSKTMRDRCEELLVNGKFALLNKFFESYCPDESVVNNYRKQLLSAGRTCEAFIFEPNKWCEFEKFVGSVDSNSPLYNAVGNQVLRSCELAYFDDWSNVEQLDHLEKAFVQFFTEEEELVKLKAKFSYELRSLLSTFFSTFVSAEGKFFTAEFLKKFVSWLNSNDKSFKSKLLNVDSIFASTITKLLRIIRLENMNDYLEVHKFVFIECDKLDSKILVALDEFLKWYFGGAEQAKRYKLAKIFDVGNKEFFQELNSTAKIDNRNFSIVLAWMLENDEEEIRKFKTKCSYEDILEAMSTLHF